jgi:hypothetical protein
MVHLKFAPRFLGLFQIVEEKSVVSYNIDGVAAK